MTLQETRKALIEYRTHNGISQQQIANKMGCTQASISDFEHRELIGWNNLESYAAALDIELDIQIKSRK